jgi:hypothetical protein
LHQEIGVALLENKEVKRNWGKRTKEQKTAEEINEKKAGQISSHELYFSIKRLSLRLGLALKFENGDLKINRKESGKG